MQKALLKSVKLMLFNAETKSFATNTPLMHYLLFSQLIQNHSLDSIGKDYSCDAKAKILICNDEKTLKHHG